MTGIIRMTKDGVTVSKKYNSLYHRKQILIKWDNSTSVPYYITFCPRKRIAVRATATKNN